MERRKRKSRAKGKGKGKREGSECSLTNDARIKTWQHKYWPLVDSIRPGEKWGLVGTCTGKKICSDGCSRDGQGVLS